MCVRACVRACVCVHIIVKPTTTTRAMASGKGSSRVHTVGFAMWEGYPGARVKGRSGRPSKYVIIIMLAVSYKGLRGREKSEDPWWPHHWAQLVLWTLLESSVVIRMMVVGRRAFRYGKNTGQASLTLLTKLTKGTGPNNNIQKIC